MKNEKPDEAPLQLQLHWLIEVGWRQHKKKKLTRLLCWWFLLASQIHSPQSHNPVCVDSTSLLKLHCLIKIIIQISGTRMTASDLKWFSIVILLMELTWYWLDKPWWARSFIALSWYVRRIICILLICVDMYVVYSYSRSRSGDIVLCFLVFFLRERYKEVKSCLLRLIAPDPFIGGGWYLRSSFDCCLPSRANVIIVTCSDLSEIIFRLMSEIFSSSIEWLVRFDSCSSAKPQCADVIYKIWKCVNPKH